MKIFLVLTILLLCSCQNIEKHEQLEKQVVDAIYKHIGWAIPDKKKDVVLKSIVPDTTFFIFNPDSAGTISGYSNFEKLVERFFMNPRFKSIDFTIKNLRVNISESGTVAWFSCLLDDFGQWDGKPVNWRNVRWTGVLEKRNNAWLICQMHFSYPK